MKHKKLLALLIFCGWTLAASAQEGSSSEDAAAEVPEAATQKEAPKEQPKEEAASAADSSQSSEKTPEKAEAAPLLAAPAVNERLIFYSKKPWNAARWFVAGRRAAGNVIEWADGQTTTVRFGEAGCNLTDPLFSIERDGKEEVLLSRDWILIEVSPEKPVEDVILQSGEGCESNLRWSFDFESKNVGLKPILFFGNIGNNYFGKSFVLNTPEKRDSEKIQLDLMLAYRLISFGNADSSEGAKDSMSLVPVAIARGAWAPRWAYGFGGTLEIEEVVASFGGGSRASGDTTIKQGVIFSDWSVGLFYQYQLSVMQGLVLKASLKYWQHMGDQQDDITSFAREEGNQMHLTPGFTWDLLVGRRWLVGSDVQYGIPSNFAGRGSKQGMIDGVVRTAFNTTDVMSILGEFNYRKYIYSAESVEDTGFWGVQFGVRLSL